MTNHQAPSFRDRGRIILHAIQHAVGLPVEYTPIEFQRSKDAVDWAQLPAKRERVLAALFGCPRSDISDYVDEAEALPNCDAPGAGPGTPMGHTDCVTLYAAVRAGKPLCLVETGTGSGASAFYSLSALAKNGVGHLHSIDPARDRSRIARLVDDSLRDQLTLHAGTGLDVLPDLVTRIGPIDFFLHDSSHTYVTMMAELRWAATHLAAGGIICSHDVLMNNVWHHFTRRQPGAAAVLKNLGLCRQPSE